MAEQKPTPENKEPSISDVLAGVDPKQLALAEKMGIPLQKLIDYMAYQEKKINYIAENAIDGEQLKKGLNEWAGELRQKQAAQIQNMPQAGGNPGSLGNALQLLLQSGMLGGGGQNEQLNQMAMKALESQINMSQSISNAVITKIMGKATSDVADAVIE